MPIPEFSEAAAAVRQFLGDRPRSKLGITFVLLKHPALWRKLEQVERVLGEDQANQWLVGQLVATGHYEADGDYVRPLY